MSRLLIYGATGTTGRRLAELAVQAGRDVVVAGRRGDEVRAIGRDLGCEARVSTLNQLPIVLTDVDVVASCVGPYTLHGGPVLEAAIDAGAHYLDLTGEPKFVRAMIERWDTSAIAAGVTLVPSAGLGLCSGIAARAAVEALPESVRRVVIGYRPNAMRASTGTLRSTIELLAGGALIARGGTLRRVPPGRQLARTPAGLGVLFPLVDPLTLHQLWPDADIAGYFVSPAAPVIAPVFLGIRAAGRLSPRTVRFLERRLRGADEPRGGIRIAVRAEGTTTSRIATVEVADLYETTSRAALEIADALLGATTPPGVLASASVVGAPTEVALRIGAQLSLSDAQAAEHQPR